MKSKKNNHSRHLLPINISKKDFLDAFKQNFIVKETSNSSDEFILLDSFEWGLHFNGYIAAYQTNQLKLWKQEDCLDPELSLDIDNISAKTRFWWELPQNEETVKIKNILKKYLNLRALNPVYKGMLKVQQFSLQNEEGKFLVDCQLISVHAVNSPRTPKMRQIKLIPLMGYEHEHKKAMNLLNDLGAFKPQLDPMTSLFNALGLIPQVFSIKPNLSIPKDISSRKAISLIISTMIKKQRMTEAGIIKDIDTEFLHHFRVALRMVRAAVAQLKVVFPEQDVTMLKDRFGALARNTNLLRDLDVFIMEKDYYLGLIPTSLANGLIPMFDDFEQRRTVEVKRIAKWLSTKAYEKEITQLEDLFKNGYRALETQWSEMPSIELAVNKIQKRYKVIQKSAAIITADTPDEDIHRIRIDCKKLRYLLYFFDGLFDKKQVKIAINHLKSLQDKLGTFNDLTVQGEFLEDYLDKIEHKPKKDILLIAALGGLISTLHTKQVQERDDCIKELAIFSNEKNRQLFKTTFVV